MTTAEQTGNKLNGHQRRRLETRRLILEAGSRLFAQRGLASVSIDAITAEAGVAKGSFYNHFDSRDALFLVVLETTLQSVLNRYRDYSPAIDEPLALAIERTQFGFETLLADRQACLLLLRAAEANVSDTVSEVLRMALGTELEEAIAAGRHSDLDLPLVINAYFAVVAEVIGQLLRKDEAMEAAEGARQVTKLGFAVLGLAGVEEKR
jgi:AcrR family transcriptional regulator